MNLHKNKGQYNATPVPTTFGVKVYWKKTTLDLILISNFYISDNIADADNKKLPTSGLVQNSKQQFIIIFHEKKDVFHYFHSAHITLKFVTFGFAVNSFHLFVLPGNRRKEMNAK